MGARGSLLAGIVLLGLLNLRPPGCEALRDLPDGFFTPTTDNKTAASNGATPHLDVIGEDRKELLGGLLETAGPDTRIVLNFSSVVLQETLSVPENVTITAATGARPVIRCSSDGSAFAIRSHGVQISGLRIENCAYSAVTVGPMEAGSTAVKFNNMEFANNAVNGNDGGAMYIDTGAEVDIANSTFENNSALRGGAIFSAKSTVNITGCKFKDNFASIDGGAIHAEDYDIGYTDSDKPSRGHSLQVSQSTFKFNNALRYLEDSLGLTNELGGPMEFSRFLPLLQPAPSGGALFVNGMDLVEIAYCTFLKNNAPAGGAIYTTDNLVVNIQQSTFSKNFLTRPSQDQQNSGDSQMADGMIMLGGAIYASMLRRRSTYTVKTSVFESNNGVYGGAVHVVGPDFSKLVIEECDFTANKAEASGGALLIRNIKDVQIYSIRVLNNSGHSGGGMAWINGASGLITMNSLFKDNRAVEGGAAIFFGAGQVQIQQTVFEDNVAKNIGGAAALIHSTVRGRIGFSETTFKNNIALTGGAIFANGVATLDFRLVNEFLSNSALSGGALLVRSQNPISNDFSSIGATFDSNVAGEGVCNSKSGEEYAPICERKIGAVFPVDPSCGVGGGGAICLLVDSLPDRSTARIQIQDGAFTANRAEFGGAMYIQIAGNKWTDKCPAQIFPLQEKPCRTVSIVNPSFDRNMASEASPDIFTNDAASLFIAYETPVGKVPTFVSLEDSRGE